MAILLGEMLECAFLLEAIYECSDRLASEGLMVFGEAVIRRTTEKWLRVFGGARVGRLEAGQVDALGELGLTFFSSSKLRIFQPIGLKRMATILRFLWHSPKLLVY
jgi:hypothetical protein